MGSLPKPLIGLLLGTVAFFALWTVALKPHSSSSSSSGSQGALQSAVNQAHGAVTTSNQANAKLGAPTATTSASTAKPATAAKATTTPSTKPAPAPKAKTATTAHAANSGASAQASTAALVRLVQNALREHGVLAVLFYNPAAADDRAVASEVEQVTGPNPKVTGVIAPVSELTKFEMITSKVQVSTSPTLIIIDAKGRATTLTGYAGTGEITQRINDALAAK